VRQSAAGRRRLSSVDGTPYINAARNVQSHEAEVATRGRYYFNGLPQTSLGFVAVLCMQHGSVASSGHAAWLFHGSLSHGKLRILACNQAELFALRAIQTCIRGITDKTEGKTRLKSSEFSVE